MASLFLKLCLFLCQLHQLSGLLNYGREGDACNRNDSNWYAVPNSRHHFIYCHPKHGIYVKDQCAMVHGQRKEFDAEVQQCVTPTDHKKSFHPMSSIARCSSSRDCPDEKWFCSTKGRCTCKNEFVQIGTQCWNKMGINEGECYFDQQCSSVWATAKCIKKKCACPPPFIVVSTFHGLVCTLPDECPMGSKTSVLLTTMNCHVRGGCGKHSNLEHLFDCVHFGSSASMCCPNRAYTCMQPVMPGNGPGKVLRYYYDVSSDRCISFMFRGGTLINTNVFQSKRECEIYCRAECPRGLVEKSPTGQTVRCMRDSDCGGKHACYKQDANGDGVCCPSKDWICSNEGGVMHDSVSTRTTEFDAGTALEHVTSVFYPVIRYFYSRSEHRCKAFLFQGEGGNFNHFLSIEQCKNFCSSVACAGEPFTVNGKVVSCFEGDTCANGFACTFGVCCRKKEMSCMTGYEPLASSGSQYGQSSVQECSHNSDCPLPYVCQVSNSLARGNGNGLCCRKRKLKFSKLKPQEHFLPVSPNTGTASFEFTKTTFENSYTEFISTSSLSTTTPAMVATTHESRMIVTVKPIAHCPGNRELLMNENGNPSTCDFSTLAPGEDSSYVQRCGGSGDHKCSFANLNMTSGFCCSEMETYEHRCPDGLVPLLDNVNDKVRLCSPLLPNSCREGNSYCVFDELFGSYHCCRNHTIEATTTTTTVAPTTSTEAVTTTVSTTTTVAPTRPSTTTQSTTTMMDENYYGCEFGKTSFKDPLTSEALTCNASVRGSCPPGFTCYFSKMNQRDQCCGMTSVCSENSAAYISPVTSKPVSCSERIGCPKGFFCFAPHKSTSNGGMCCSEDPVASLCDHGMALKDNRGRAFKCESGACPKGYKCTSRFNFTICCPTSQNVCRQQFNQGLPCEEAPPQSSFFFDPETRACLEFTYSGCGGNDNRFDSKEDCQSFCKSTAVCSVGMPLVLRDGKIADCSDGNQCLAGYECTVSNSGSYCCPKPEMTCSLPRDSGAVCAVTGAEPNSPQLKESHSLFWHFSISDTACVLFEYHGCGGNFNRFSSQRHCNLACAHVLCPAGHPKMNGGNVVKCSEHARCGEGYVCSRSSLGVHEVSVCCPKPDILCEGRLEPAAECIEGQVRYKYDNDIKQCVRFSTGGCLSTDNSFTSRAECDRVCIHKESQCPDDSEAFIDRAYKRPLTCSVEYESCPPGYACVPGRNGLYHYCCTDERCPGEQVPLLSSNGTKLTCSTGPFGFLDGCPSGYKCEKMATGRQLCCPQKKTKDVCLYPSRPFIHTIDGKPMICSEKYNRCPFGYKCVENAYFGEHFCCSDLGDVTSSSTERPTTTSTTKSSAARCEDGSEPLGDEYGVRICNPHLPFSCPEGHICEYNDDLKQTQCCKMSNFITDRLFDSKSACPLGMAVRPHPTTNQPIVCQPEVSNYCPRHSQCEYSGMYWQYICCVSLGAQEFYDIPNDFPNSRVLFPGEAGCQHDQQCQLGDPNSRCHNWVCICPGFLVHDRKCVDNCPLGLAERDGRCA